MRNSKRVIAGVVIGAGLALAGCVTMGRPIDRPGTPAVPLVPLPPPPLGQNQDFPIIPTARAALPAPPEIPSKAAPIAPSSSEGSPPPAARLISPKTSVPKAAAENAPANREALNAPAPAFVPTVRSLVGIAQKRYAKLDSYIVRLTRREVINDRAKPEELMAFYFRKEPWSVRLKWLSKEGEGRDVVYVKGKHQGKIHSKLAAGDLFFNPAGYRVSMTPDHVLVKRATRHPITEAGIGASVARLAAVQTAMARGDRRKGELTVLAAVKRPEFTKPVSAIEHAIPAGVDPSLPRGGKRTYFIDPNNQLPTLIQTMDDAGKEVEYYRYDRLQPQVKLDDADFDPNELWGKPARASR